MIKILHIVIAMNRGGIETFIMNLYRNIDRNKIQFDFIVHTDKECVYDQEIKALGGKIYSVPPRNKGIFKNKNALDNFFKNHSEYKVVHQHVSSLTYLEPLRAAKRHNISTRIIHGHSTAQGGNPLHKYVHHLNQFFLEFYATDYFACSDLAAKWLFGRRRYKKDEHIIIKNGIEADKFKFNAQIRKKYREKLKINDKFVIGHVGRFSYPKNHEFLIDIFKVFNEKNPNSVLLLVGDGELRDSIEKKCKELELEEKVVFMGVCSDISNLLQTMDVFVFPSHYEGLPVTLVEAQAAGLVCLASDIITNQVNITEFINNISLNCSSHYWADTIIKITENHNRINTTNIIKSKGFDISSVTEDLTQYYVLVSKEK